MKTENLKEKILTEKSIDLDLVCEEFGITIDDFEFANYSGVSDENGGFGYSFIDTYYMMENIEARDEEAAEKIKQSGLIEFIDENEIDRLTKQ